MIKYNDKVGLNYDHSSMPWYEMHRWIDIWPQITEKDSNVATAILLDQCCHKGDQISVASFCIKPDHYVWPPRCDLRLVYETDCIAYRVYNFDGFFVVNPIKVWNRYGYIFCHSNQCLTTYSWQFPSWFKSSKLPSVNFPSCTCSSITTRHHPHMRMSSTQTMCWSNAWRQRMAIQQLGSTTISSFGYNSSAIACPTSFTPSIAKSFGSVLSHVYPN